MQTALDAAKRAKQDTVAYLIEEVHLSPSLLAETISAEFAEPYFDLMFMTLLRFLKIWSIRN